MRFRRAGCGCLPALTVVALVALAVVTVVLLLRDGDQGSAAACRQFNIHFGSATFSESDPYELSSKLEEIRDASEEASDEVRGAIDALVAASHSGEIGSSIAASAALTKACADAGHAP